MKKLPVNKFVGSIEKSLFSTIAERSISLYQKEISPHKGYRCAHAQCRGGLSCSAFIQNVIESSPDGGLSPEEKKCIAERLRECKSMSTVAGLNTYQSTKKILLTAGAIGAGVFLISASAFAATCDDSGGGGGCGGGSDDSPSTDCKTEVINGITVPLEPDVQVNNSTLAGVDSNSNGVRDDVERLAAINFNEKNTARIYTAAQYAQRAITTKNSAELFNFQCAASNMNEEDIEVLKNAIFNTKERRSIYNTLDSKAGATGTVTISTDGTSVIPSQECANKYSPVN